MRLLNVLPLREFVGGHANAKKQFDAWEAAVKELTCKTPHELLQRFPTADIQKQGNVIFNVKGGNYRLWTQVDYTLGIMRLVKVGTHNDYNQWRIP